ncbi:hypothetical protein Tco_1385081 [Tanacetum coccineum]
MKHHWRNDKTFNGKSDNRPKPKKLTSARIIQQLADLPSRIPGKHPSYGGVKRPRDPIVERNWSKRSIFYKLPYWSSLPLKHNLDVMHIEKNVLESILGTLLMNDKSKDTNKARQDLEQLNIRPELWLSKKGNGKFIKPHPVYSFTPEKRQKFCEFIKGVKLPDGFGSNFKPKVTDNDNNIIGMKSHDCHLMMQRLLPAGAQAYLDSSIATPIIELCSFFKQICARSIIESDMLIAEDQLSIYCAISSEYISSFFDITDSFGHTFNSADAILDDWWKENQYILATQMLFMTATQPDVALTANLEDLEYTRLSGAGPSTESASLITLAGLKDIMFCPTMAMAVREDGPPNDDTWEPRPIKKNAKEERKALTLNAAP